MRPYNKVNSLCKIVTQIAHFQNFQPTLDIHMCGCFLQGSLAFEGDVLTVIIDVEGSNRQLKIEPISLFSLETV